MGFIHKIAEKIVAKRNARIALEKSNSEYFQKMQARRVVNLITKSTNILHDKLDKFEKTSNIKPIFEAGDTAIINKYSIDYNSSNGWDGGANLIASSIKDRPVFVKITSVYITHELASELIDKFIDSLTFGELEFQLKRESLWYEYNKWFRIRNDKNVNSNVFKRENLGLYVTVNFDIIGKTDLKPTWGLNEYSLLKVGTESADITEELWRREIKHTSQTKLLYKRRKEWEADRNKVSTIKIKHI